jgi:hypothetical protein
VYYVDVCTTGEIPSNFDKRIIDAITHLAKLSGAKILKDVF